MIRWEYIRVLGEWPMRADDALLAEKGEQGWELCAVTDSGVGMQKHYYFKRRMEGAA